MERRKPGAILGRRFSFLLGVQLAIGGVTIRTPEKRQAVLDALRLHPSITRACKSARISRNAFYEWRNDDPDFATEIEASREKGIDALEDSLFRDAIEGHNTTAAIFMLKSWRRERYGDRQHVDLNTTGSISLDFTGIDVPLPVRDDPTDPESP